MLSYALGAIALVLFIQWMIGEDETRPENNNENGNEPVQTGVQGKEGDEPSG